MGIEKKPSAVEKTWATPSEFRAENGRTYFVNRWSIRKFSKMGRSISKIFNAMKSIIAKNVRAEYDDAVKRAEENGYKPGHPEYPDIEAYQRFQIGDVIDAIPVAVETAVTEIAMVVSQSLTGEENGPVTEDDVLDEFTPDDLAEVLVVIVEKNFPEGLGKWKGLLGRISEIMTPSRES